MPITENDVRWVEAPKLGFWDQLYLPAMVDGLKTTLGRLREFKDRWAQCNVLDVSNNSNRSLSYLNQL